MRSRVLIVGGTGVVGKYVALASARLGHPTFVLVRDPSPSDPAKVAILDSFRKANVTLLTGDLNEQATLVAAVKQVDVVISVVGRPQILDQLKLLEAIKEVGTIKRFTPSEFGNYSDRKLKILDDAYLDNKATVADAVRKSGVPYTFVISGGGVSYYLHNLWQKSLKAPPRDKITILGDGNAKAVIISDEDIGTYTVLAVDDPRTENKTLYVRPPGIYLSQNEIVALWEQKIGHTLEKAYIPDEELVKTIEVRQMGLEADTPAAKRLERVAEDYLQGDKSRSDDSLKNLFVFLSRVCPSITDDKIESLNKKFVRELDVGLVTNPVLHIPHPVVSNLSVTSIKGQISNPGTN